MLLGLISGSRTARAISRFSLRDGVSGSTIAEFYFPNHLKKKGITLAKPYARVASYLEVHLNPQGRNAVSHSDRTPFDFLGRRLAATGKRQREK